MSVRAALFLKEHSSNLFQVESYYGEQITTKTILITFGGKKLWQKQLCESTEPILLTLNDINIFIRLSRNNNYINYNFYI